MRRVVSLLVLFALTGCCPGPQPAQPPVPTTTAASVTAAPTAAPSAAPAPAADPVVERASELVSLAAKVEPGVTPVLQDLAKAHGGSLVKLEYRLKTQASTERKLRKALTQRPNSSPNQVRIDDALRYTMLLSDEPSGRYVSGAKAVLAALEAEGHVVQYVKNYWPKDDNYSGVNSVLLHPSGLFWELQFHTQASFEVQNATRPQYEEIRTVATPLERKRELFDAMTKRWNEVPIPQGALQQGALHGKDQVRERARP